MGTEKAYVPNPSAHVYALVDHPTFGSCLHEVLPGPIMANRGPIRRRVSPTSNQTINHLMGMTWDPDLTCAWFVSDNTASNSAHRNRLWRFTGGLPLSGSSGINVDIGAPLIELATGDTVRDAMDIEFDPTTHMIYLLRGGGRFATVSVAPGSVGVVSDIGPCPPMQAFSFDCTGEIVTYRSTDGTTLRMDRTLAPLGLPVPFCVGLPVSADAGLEPIGPNCEAMAITAYVPLNNRIARIPIGTVTPILPALNTLDMTTMP